MIRARSHLNAVQPCPHGSISRREMAERVGSSNEIIDFSASCNPLGPSVDLKAVLEGLDISRYPDNEGIALKCAIAESLEISPDWLVLGNGSVELIWLLAMAFLDQADKVLVVGPTFGEYARACQIAGAAVDEYRASEDSDFQVDTYMLGQLVSDMRPKLMFLCNPNNPTGRILTASQIERLLDYCRDTLLIVDEAYIPFSDEQPDLRSLLPGGKLLILRSMTKDHGLAGLRLGYAVAVPEIIGWLQRVRPPWNVNAVAQEAGLAALWEMRHVEEARATIIESRAFLVEQLSKMGLRVVPSVANFLLVRVGNGSSFRSELMNHGVCVRDCASFGLPEYVRIGIRRMSDCQKLVWAIRKALFGD